ncbi:MAG: class I SAM-dependent RNA methyltransferase [Micavibrio aeruginosavorus]|uniref:Class I SAM-dependent RNA methyltransferase n=1 Tax=Micavibrio aeruginosavorus TaxID=349221 RepID=A0A2W5BZ71_9BACT|nr:MAG: class I SAM-dependent RNA methyltransferase [Micavibrio aeruginosavorus]
MGMAMTQVQLSITALGAGGDGIAHDADGQPVFVPLSVTGDVVLAEVDAERRGKITEIIEASPNRTAPPCRHFGICGGCALQHVKDDAYRAFKVDAVTQVLQRNGITLPETVETVFIPARTRRRANFAARVVKGRVIIGFHERKSANVRDVPDCLLITEDVRHIMEGIRPYLRDIAGAGGRMDVLVQCADGQAEVGLTGKIAPGWEAQQALSDALRTLDLSRISIRARDYEAYEILLEAKGFYKSFGGLRAKLAPGAFLQPSAEGERALSDIVIRGAGDARRIADLFCGNGTFTGPLLDGREVTAADFAPDAIAALREAGANAHLRNLFKNPLDPFELEDRDCVILDPPRAGAQAQVEMLGKTKVPHIVYVSCNPQSFARDAVILRDGGYTLSALTIVDQFIWSAHTEIIGIFDRSLT